MIAPASRKMHWGILLAAVAGLFAIYLLRYVLLPFVAAAALAYLARPVIAVLQRRLRFPRWAAALVPYLFFVLALAAGGYWVWHILLPELSDVIRNLQGSIQRFLETLFGSNIDLFGRHTTAQGASSDAVERLTALWQANVQGLAEDAIAIVTGLILTFVVLAFLLFTGPRLAEGALWLVPPHLRPWARELAGQIDPMLGSYLRGVFAIVAFAIITTYAITGLVFHLPHAVLLAIGVGMLELVPVVGPILSFVAFALIILQQRAFGSIVGFGAFAVALRIAIDQLVAPLVLGRAAKIPSLVVIFSFLAGGTLFGVLGFVLAIPAAAAVKIVIANLYESGGPSVAESDEAYSEFRSGG